jgi:hypothetical protein
MTSKSLSMCDEELGQLRQAPSRKGKAVIGRAGQGDLLYPLALRRREGWRQGTRALWIQRIEAEPAGPPLNTATFNPTPTCPIRMRDRRRQVMDLHRQR